MSKMSSYAVTAIGVGGGLASIIFLAVYLNNQAKKSPSTASPSIPTTQVGSGQSTTTITVTEKGLPFNIPWGITVRGYTSGGVPYNQSIMAQQVKGSYPDKIKFAIPKGNYTVTPDYESANNINYSTNPTSATVGSGNALITFNYTGATA